VIVLLDILQAKQRLQAWLNPTLLEAAPALPGNVWLKLENTNPTHSFKVRGALNAVLALNEAERKRGIIAVSSGNHAQGIAYAARQVGATARILMPKHTPQRKVNGVIQQGAEAILFGATYDDAELEGRRLERAEGWTFISPYNDARVAAGAGTIGLEIVMSLPEVERVVVPVSGGGLIAGIATAVKSIKPDVEVIGINADSAPAMYNEFYGTHKPQIWETLAEALSGEIEAGSITIPIAKQYVDRVLLVDEAQIAAAMRWLLFTQGWLVEGGGAVGVAAALHHLLPDDKRPTVIVISGGNLDEANIRQIL
jgi:threonine dehydratase